MNTLTTTFALIALAVLGVGLLIVFSKTARKIATPFWRFASGALVLRPMGEYDASFRLPAPPPPSGGLLRGQVIPRTAWARWPGYKRMWTRWAALAGLTVFLYYPLWVTVLTVLVLVILAGRKLHREWQDYWHGRVTRRWVESAAQRLGWGEQDPATWIAVPRPQLEWHPLLWPDWLTSRIERKERLVKALYAMKLPIMRIPLDDDDAQVVVHHPAAIDNSAAIKEAASLICSRLDEGPWESDHSNKDLKLVIKHPKRPPKYVAYDDELNAKYDVFNVPIGKSAQGVEVIKVKDLTPHTTISATTGWCKTSTLNAYIAHVASKGAQVMINDPKRVGFIKAFGGLRHVSIKTDTEGQVAHIEAFLAELERRYRLIERYPEINEAAHLYFQPWFYIEDEKGSLMADIADWWKAQEGKGTPEPFRQLKKILWQARAACMYVVTAEQQANLKVFIDSDGRDQYQARIASGPQTRSAWQMLFPGLKKRKMPMKKGRAVFAEGVDEGTDIQLAAIGEDEARRFAEMGTAVIDKENSEREQRLSKLTGGSVPAGTDAAGGAETLSNVPVQTPDTGTANHDQELATKNNFRVLPGGGQDNSGRDTESALMVITNDHRDSSEEVPEPAESGQQEVTEADSETADLIVGNKSASEFLDMKLSAFEQARKRARREAREQGRPESDGIPGETTVGMSPAWPRRALAEWHSARPRAGARSLDDAAAAGDD